MVLFKVSISFLFELSSFKSLNTLIIRIFKYLLANSIISPLLTLLLLIDFSPGYRTNFSCFFACHVILDCKLDIMNVMLCVMSAFCHHL